MRNKLLITIAVGALCAPVVAQADTSPTSTDASNAAKQCKALRTSSGSAENFRSAVATLVPGTKVTKANAYGKCVSFYAKDEAKERSQAQSTATKNCKAERDAATTPEQQQAFADKYGAKNVHSAYGKCVSSQAKTVKAQDDQVDQDRVNAAKQCKTERGTTDASKAAFAKKYKTFGTCVSTKAHEANAQRQAANTNS